VKLALSKLSNPQVRKLRERELGGLNASIQKTIEFNGFQIKTYEWPGEKEAILLIHGWEGQAGNFVDLIEKLSAEGFHVYAFDAPSHGFSSKGKTSILDFVDLVGAMIESLDVKKLISHSFGGVATTYAMYKNPKLEIEKYGLFTTPDRFLERIEDVSKQYGIDQKVTDKLIAKIERDYQMKVKDLNVSDFVKTIKVKEAVIFHDVNDGVLPIERSKNVNNHWEASSLIEVEGTGHFAILRNENVLRQMVAFIR